MTIRSGGTVVNKTDNPNWPVLAAMTAFGYYANPPMPTVEQVRCALNVLELNLFDGAQRELNHALEALQEDGS